MFICKSPAKNHKDTLLGTVFHSLISEDLVLHKFENIVKEIKSPPDVLSKEKTRPLAEAFPDQNSLDVKKT